MVFLLYAKDKLIEQQVSEIKVDLKQDLLKILKN